MKLPDFEIGDSVVFAKPVPGYSSDDPKWKTGRVVDVVDKLVEVEFRSLLGFYRRKWLSPTGLHSHGWMIHRKDRADEMIARYQSKP
jgi:hypothetical protein